MIGKPKPQKKEKKKKPVKRVSSRGSLIKKAHSIMREIVVLRDGSCVCPAPEKGHTSVLQAGHLVPSTKPGTRFDLWNVHCQCSACNGRHTRYEYYYTNWFLKKFGQDAYNRVARDADFGSLKAYEVEEIIVQLSEILDKQKESPEWKPYFSQQEIASGAWRTK